MIFLRKLNWANDAVKIFTVNVGYQQIYIIIFAKLMVCWHMDISYSIKADDDIAMHSSRRIVLHIMHITVTFVAIIFYRLNISISLQKLSCHTHMWPPWGPMTGVGIVDIWYLSCALKVRRELGWFWIVLFDPLLKWSVTASRRISERKISET